MTAIVEVIAREILDSRGNPTIEADVVLANAGAALRRLCAQLGVRAAFFVGGPGAHEELRRAEVPGLVSVQVGSPAPAADWLLEDQGAIDEVLRAALEAGSLGARARSAAQDA